MACQSPGNPGGLGGGFGGRLRRASEYNLLSSEATSPVFASIFRILMPVQKLPNESQAWP